MTTTLRAQIVRRLDGHAPGIERVLACFQRSVHPRHSHLLHQGDACSRVYFLSSGILQIYSLGENARESTRDIVFEGDWCTDLEGFKRRTPALESIRALVDSEVHSIDYATFDALVSSTPLFERVYRQILEASYLTSVNRVRALVAMTATERIQWLADHHPAVLGRVSSKVAASYLGIAEETYCRLRKKLGPLTYVKGPVATLS